MNDHNSVKSQEVREKSATRSKWKLVKKVTVRIEDAVYGELFHYFNNSEFKMMKYLGELNAGARYLKEDRTFEGTLEAIEEARKKLSSKLDDINKSNSRLEQKREMQTADGSDDGDKERNETAEIVGGRDADGKEDDTQMSRGDDRFYSVERPPVHEKGLTATFNERGFKMDRTSGLDAISCRRDFRSDGATNDDHERKKGSNSINFRSIEVAAAAGDASAADEDSKGRPEKRDVPLSSTNLGGCREKDDTQTSFVVVQLNHDDDVAENSRIPQMTNGRRGSDSNSKQNRGDERDSTDSLYQSFSVTRGDGENERTMKGDENAVVQQSELDDPSIDRDVVGVHGRYRKQTKFPEEGPAISHTRSDPSDQHQDLQDEEKPKMFKASVEIDIKNVIVLRLYAQSLVSYKSIGYCSATRIFTMESPDEEDVKKFVEQVGKIRVHEERLVIPEKFDKLLLGEVLFRDNKFDDVIIDLPEEESACVIYGLKLKNVHETKTWIGDLIKHNEEVDDKSEERERGAVGGHATEERERRAVGEHATEERERRVVGEHATEERERRVVGEHATEERERRTVGEHATGSQWVQSSERDLDLKYKEYNAAIWLYVSAIKKKPPLPFVYDRRTGGIVFRGECLKQKNVARLKSVERNIKLVKAHVPPNVPKEYKTYVLKKNKCSEAIVEFTREGECLVCGTSDDKLKTTAEWIESVFRGWKRDEESMKVAVVHQFHEVTSIQTMFSPKEKFRLKGISLKVCLIRNEISSADPPKIIFTPGNKDIFSKYGGDFNDSNFKNFGDVWESPLPKKALLVCVGTDQSTIGEDELKCLYKDALYRASNGEKSLAMTLTLLKKFPLHTNVPILCNVIATYDAGERPHNRLEELHIVSLRDDHLDHLNDYFLRSASGFQ